MKRLFELIIILFFTWSILSAIGVNIILNDGSVIKANMLGKTADEIFLQDDDGKAKTMKIADIKAMFNAGSGEPIDLFTGTNAQTPTNLQVVTNDSSVIAVEPVPGSPVYYGNANGEVIYYYGGIWWRNGGGLWYRAFGYNGPWIIIDNGYVPYPVFHIGPRWFFHEPRHIFFRHRR